MQTRLFNFGDDLTAEKFGYMLDAEFISIVIDGFGMTPGMVDTITLAPGRGVVVGIPSGITNQTARIITESESQTINVTTGALAKNYTVLYEHADSLISGGVSAVLDVVEGLYTSYTDGLILGWIVYPGGSIPVDATMIYHAPKLNRTAPIFQRWERADTRHPPFFGLAEVSVSTDITYALDTSLTGYLAYKFYCSLTAVGTQEAVFITQHRVEDDGANILTPRALLVGCEVPTVSNYLKIQLYDSSGTLVDTETISNIASYADQTWDITRDLSTATFTEDGVFLLKWTVGMTAGSTIYWGRFSVDSTRDLPFAVGYTNAGP